MVRYFYLLILVVIFFLLCEDVIEVDVFIDELRLVLDGFIRVDII